MAKTWRNRMSRNSSATIELKGFEELYDKLREVSQNAQKEANKCAEHCADATYDALYFSAQDAGLDNDLLEQLDEKLYGGFNSTYIEIDIGWKKVKPTKSNPIPDFYKVLFYNYGTPSERFTKTGASRGIETSHPPGSHGFIKKGKIRAKNKCRKIQKDTLDKILKGLK